MEKLGLELTVHDITYVYRLQKTGKDQYTLVARNWERKRMTGLPDSSKGRDEDFLVFIGNWQHPHFHCTLAPGIPGLRCSIKLFLFFVFCFCFFFFFVFCFFSFLCLPFLLYFQTRNLQRSTYLLWRIGLQSIFCESRALLIVRDILVRPLFFSTTCLLIDHFKKDQPLRIADRPK